MLFEKATRSKFRFQTDRGQCSTEDLWDLPLTQLNNIAKSLRRQIKETQEEDFLSDVSKEDAELKAKFDVVIYIIETKKSEAKERAEASTKKLEKEKIMAILAKKQEEALSNLSEEELLTKLKGLN